MLRDGSSGQRECRDSPRAPSGRIKRRNHGKDPVPGLRWVPGDRSPDPLTGPETASDQEIYSLFLELTSIFPVSLLRGLSSSAPLFPSAARSQCQQSDAAGALEGLEHVPPPLRPPSHTFRCGCCFSEATNGNKGQRPPEPPTALWLTSRSVVSPDSPTAPPRLLHSGTPFETSAPCPDSGDLLRRPTVPARDNKRLCVTLRCDTMKSEETLGLVDVPERYAFQGRVVAVASAVPVPPAATTEDDGGQKDGGPNTVRHGRSTGSTQLLPRRRFSPSTTSSQGKTERSLRGSRRKAGSVEACRNAVA
ncbi:hypothetical protein GN956_G23200 [Arapaima gigas]